MNGTLITKTFGVLFSASAVLHVACGAEPADSDPTLDSLVEAEHAFARSAAKLGTRNAFLKYLADDAILFRPRATNGKRFLAAQSDVSGLLSWEPALADVSLAADLGFTTGPWSYSPDPDSDPTAHGQYFTVWKLQPDGSWKVAIDHGTYNPPPTNLPSRVERPTAHRADRRRAEREIDPETEIERVLRKDRAFATAIATQGKPQAINAFFTADVHVLRDGRQPRRGIDAARAAAAERPGRLTWRVLGGDVSKSGDMAFTYGEYEYQPSGAAAPEELGNYVRVWRNLPSTGGIWRVAVDLMSPLPPTAKTQEP